MIAALFRRTVSANAIRVLACGIGLLAWGLVLPFAVGHVCSESSFAELWRHELRWASSASTAAVTCSA